VAQDFIATIELKTIDNDIVIQLENKQIKDIARSTSLFIVVKKIFIFVIMQKDNIYTNLLRFALSQLLSIAYFNICFNFESFKSKSIYDYENSYRIFVFVEILSILCFVVRINYAILLIFE